MKRILSFLCVLTVAISLVAPSKAIASPAGQNPDIENISIEMQNDPERERGVLVEAYINHSTGTIHITLVSSVGIATITAWDATGAQVYGTVVDAMLTGYTQFAAPSVPGTYTLEIQSASYYGVGSFAI